MLDPGGGGGGSPGAPAPPSSGGGGDGSQAPVHHAFQLPWWPDGDPGRLRGAARAFQAAGAALAAAESDGSAAIAAVTAANTGPVFELIGQRWSTVYAGNSCLAAPTAGAPAFDNLIATCGLLANACNELAQEIDDARKKLEHLAEELVAGLVIGGLLTFVTAGLSDAAAAAEAANVIRMALELAESLEGIIAVAFRVGGFAIQGAIAAAGSDLVMQEMRIGFRDQTGFNFGELERESVFGAAAGPVLGYGSAAAGRGIGAILNARRASPWALEPFERGRAIEDLLGQNLPENYPVIDIWDGVTATSIKSIDLNAPSYARESALVRTLQGYVDKAAAFQGRTWAKVTIESSDVQSRALTIAVPPHPTAAQQKILQDIIKYGATRHVKVIIVEVP